MRNSNDGAGRVHPPTGATNTRSASLVLAFSIAITIFFALYGANAMGVSHIEQGNYLPPTDQVRRIVYPHPADNCHEDEAWAPVDWQTPNATEDVHGVTRMCVNMDSL